jgi:hypothetical protein
MFIRQHGPCAICRQQTVIETLCLDRRPRPAAERHLICDECEAWRDEAWRDEAWRDEAWRDEAWRDLDEADPDVARLVAAYRDCARDEDGW